MKRYSALLLFQFRVMVRGNPGKRRICEERIVHFRASSARRALAVAKRKGRAAQHTYLNSDGHKVYFEFVGVMDLRHLGSECEEDEVWYDIVERLLPKERKARWIPPERELDAIRTEAEL